MDFIFIISLVVFAFLAALVIILIKKILKIFIFIFILLVIFALAFGFFIYQDASDIKKNFISSNKLFLLVDEQEILTGIIVTENQTFFIEENQVNEYENYFKDKDYESLLGANNKLLLLNLDILGEKKGYELFDKNISREKLFDIFRSEEPYKELTVNEIKGSEIEKDKTKFKGYIFEKIFADDLIKPKNPFKILILYKQGHLTVYPETIFFKFVESIPTSFVDKISDKITENIENIKENIKEKI